MSALLLLALGAGTLAVAVLALLARSLRSEVEGLQRSMRPLRTEGRSGSAASAPGDL